jgi:hypothetical protein
VKRMTIVLAAVFCLLAPQAYAEEGKMVKVHHCSMCNYTASERCPICGMQMEQKEMSAADAKEASAKSSEMLCQHMKA